MLVSQQPSPHPHERIGRYEVLRKIATGGMAELFLAKQVGMEGFEKVVAIKRILAHLAFDEEFINMFRDEARIVAKLSHPNIVQIYDLGKSDDTYFIAMEYIPGRNLSSVAKKAKAKGEKLPPEFIARCIAQACEGLYYAHTRQDIDGKPLKIVHRDVSPQNIILAFSGGVKLVDFGIAKAATKIAHTRAGVLKGKYAYMSPEQIRGDEVDARSDLFAVGIVLYELLCGRRPFEKENSIQTLKAIVQEPHVDCRVLNSDIPDGLAMIIDKALSKTWVDRWTSAQELQLALEDFVAGTARRCNNIVISKWVTDLFAEELSRDRGGTMVFKGVGEVILPDLDDKPDEKKSQPGAESKSVSVELDSKVVKDIKEVVDSGGASLQRGRGGGSVNLPARPPIPAPSMALRKNTDPSGRQALIEEGIIDHPVRGSDDDDGGWTDDKTALAGDDPPKRSAAEDAAPMSELGQEYSEPELDAELQNKEPSPFDDSKTEFGADLVPGTEDDIEEIGADEVDEVGDDRDSDLDATWIPQPSELNALANARAQQTKATPRDESIVTGEAGDRDLGVAQSDDDDPWEDKTIGYPDGKPPLEEEDDAFAADGQGNTNEMAVLDRPSAEIETTVPPPREPARRGGSLLREAQGWGNLDSEEHKNDDVDLWDDKTATNDAYLEDEIINSPIVQTVDRQDVGDPTINALSLNSDILRAMSPSAADEVAEATMSGVNLAERDYRRAPDPEITGDHDDDVPDRYGDAASNDRTIAGGMPAVDDDEEAADFSNEDQTRRSFDEDQLPVPRSNKNVDADSRTVAGVTSDFVLSGLPVPNVGAYDHDDGIDINLAASQAGDIEAASAKPKPKRGGRGLGHIKLAKAPVAAATPEPVLSKPIKSAARTDARMKRFDFSEEQTEAGEGLEASSELGANLPDPETWEPEISDQGDSSQGEDDRQPTHGANGGRSFPKPSSTDGRASQLIEQAFDDFSLDDDVPPKSDPVKPAASGMRGGSSLMSVKIPPPLNAPPPTGQGPAAIGSTNVPPANLSLSEMLSIPIGNGASARSGFQVFSRSVSGAGNAPAAASGAPVPSLARKNSVASRQIRETVRTGENVPPPELNFRLPMPANDAPAPMVNQQLYPAGPPLLDFASMQPEALPPPKNRGRLWLIMGVVLAVALALVAAVLVVPQLMARDPQLTIRTMPDGADIYLNGQLQPAKTPATLGGLQPGVTYELKLVREGHEPVSKAVPIPRNTRNILVQIPLRPTAAVRPE